MLVFAWELSTWLQLLPLLGLEKRLHEHLAKCVVGILINLCMILVVGVEPFGLLSELVN